MSSWWADPTLQTDRSAFTRILKQKYPTLAMRPNEKAKVQRITQADVVRHHLDKDRIGHGPQGQAARYHAQRRKAAKRPAWSKVAYGRQKAS